MLVAMLICSLFGVAGAESVLMANAPVGGQLDDGMDSGHNVSERMSIQQINELQPNLLRRQWHDRVVIIDSYNHALEMTLASRRIWDAQKKAAHIIGVPSIAQTPVRLLAPTTFTITAADVKDVTINLGAANNDKVKECQLLILPQVQGYKPDRTTLDPARPLVLVVKDKNADGTLIVNAVNGRAVGSTQNTIPTIPVAAGGGQYTVLRAPQLGSEVQRYTGITGGLPETKDFYIMKDILQTEQTIWAKYTEKEVKWDFTELLKYALNERKNEKDSSFYLGVGAMLQDYANVHNGNRKDLAFTSEGVWWMPGKEFDCGGILDINTLIDAMDESFEGNNGSPTRCLYMGRNVQKALAKLVFPTGASVALGDVYKDKKLKIRYDSIQYMGGKEWQIVHDPALDNIGMSDAAILVDHENAYQYSFGNMKVETLTPQETRLSTEGQLITEEVANVLVNSNTHMVFYLDKANSMLSWQS